MKKFKKIIFTVLTFVLTLLAMLIYYIIKILYKTVSSKKF